MSCTERQKCNVSLDRKQELYRTRVKKKKKIFITKINPREVNPGFFFLFFSLQCFFFYAVPPLGYGNIKGCSCQSENKLI